jgi:site-specific DNA-methyltransferase (adenine-specific)
MLAYVSMMAQRLVELRRVLRKTGSIYLHCDPTASAHLRLLMDAIFGTENFHSEIVWKRTSSHNSAKRWAPVHDVILFYTRTEEYTWNRVYQPYDDAYVAAFYRYEDAKGKFRLGDLTGAGTRTGESGHAWRGVNPTDSGRHWAVPTITGMKPEKIKALSVQQRLDVLDESGLINWPKKGTIPQFRRYFDPEKGVPAQDIIYDIDPLSPHAKEKLGYPTQKPEALLERIIRASSNEGDVVLDPFCGCGTAIAVAQKMGRQWIGIDITHLAVGLIKHRLLHGFGLHAKADYAVVGEPTTIEGAHQLAADDRY